MPNDGKDPAAKSLGSRGGKARAAKLSDKRKKEIAKRAAAARWKPEKVQAAAFDATPLARGFFEIDLHIVTKQQKPLDKPSAGEAPDG